MAPWIVLFLLTLTGCMESRNIQTREVIWAKIGTPARIVDDRPVKILVPDGSGGWTVGRGVITGMVAIDEPTLEYYQKLHEKHGS